MEIKCPVLGTYPTLLLASRGFFPKTRTVRSLPGGARYDPEQRCLAPTVRAYDGIQVPFPDLRSTLVRERVCLKERRRPCQVRLPDRSTGPSLPEGLSDAFHVGKIIRSKGIDHTDGPANLPCNGLSCLELSWLGNTTRIPRDRARVMSDSISLPSVLFHPAR